ncbi:N-6 DNA methylase [Pontibacillus salipaludis]|uniref:site-specific DNA-methyltransferase (adenine-specific) n=1 Tax=Pontibacillus salipaludis TaxID=1697394 RepID=A0ABQ1QK57_9BACI|nr:N-6 DNA methylase [Pontibacillus salipaludis]GGD28859.1 hypothetical protein GCM10011389_40580 [Pontibacillus salipaludis]
MKEKMCVSPFEVAKHVRNTGLPVIQQEVKTGTRRADFIGYTVEENGSLIPQVVIEVKEAPSLDAQRQLMDYAEAFQTPYALLATPTGMIWFDTNTFLQTQKPSFQSQRAFMTEEQEIKNLFLELLNDLRGGTTSDQYWKIFIYGLTIRAYLHEQSRLEEWFSIKNKDDFNLLLTSALNHFTSGTSLSIIHLPEETILQMVLKLGNLPPTHSKYGLLIIDLIERKGVAGEYMSPAAIRELYTQLVKQLSLNSSSHALDMTAGYGGVALALMEQNLIKQLDAYELDNETSYYLKLLSYISDLNNLMVHPTDSLKAAYNQRYDLVVLDPPLAKVKGSTLEYPSLELAKNRGQLFAAELFIERGLSLLKPGGHLIVLVPEGFMFSSATSAQTTRDFIKQESIIEGIISLPSHTLKPYTSVKMNTLILRKKSSSNEVGEEVFLAKCEKIEQFTEVGEAFGEWRRGAKE